MTKHSPSLLLVMSFAAFSMTQACSCDPSIGGVCTDPQVSRNGMCCDAPSDSGDLCELGFECTPDTVVFDPNDTMGCKATCTCVPRILEPGVLSQQLDMTTTANGTVMLSGYSPGDSVAKFKFGDLVVGRWDSAADEVNWEPIDGVPTTANDGSYSADSWRGGIYALGDDVGRYSSIVANGENLIVSYEDTRLPTTTPPQQHHRLKVAVRNNGTWTKHIVDDVDPSMTSTSGGALYTSIALDATNHPVIAYGVRLRAATADAQPTGHISIARASVELPTQTSDWMITDLASTVVEVGCIQGDGLCHADATCVSIGTSGRGHCVPTAGLGDCTGCSGSQVCDAGVCAEKRTLGDLIDAQGLYNNLVRTTDGFALAFYDRSLTRQVAESAGLITVTLTGMPPNQVEVGGNTAVRNSGDALTASMIGKPVEISGVPGRRTVLTVAGNTLTFSGAPVPHPADNMPIAVTMKFFDSTGGTVWGMRLPDADADWSDNTRFPIEGYQVSNTLYGDCGVSTSLFVDSTGVWHVTFVDGTYERLRYVTVATNDSVTGRATVDDGYPGANHRPSDRPALGGERRLVGDGSSVVVTSTGEVRVLYQDTTRIYPIMARCTSNCTQAPVACLTKASCGAFGADSECNQGFCSNTNWVATPAVTLPADTNASPNGGYYTVQIADMMDTTQTFVAWLQRALQPDSDFGITEVNHIAPVTP